MVSIVHRYPRLKSQITPHPEPVGKLLLLGTCTVMPMLEALRAKGVHAEHYLCESYTHSAIPDVDQTDYDAVVLALTLRHIYMEAAHHLAPDTHFSNCIAWPRMVAEGREQEYFDVCAELIRARATQLCSAIRGRPSFILSFVDPKHNYLGNLMPRYKLSNPVYFVERLNQVLEEALEAFPEAHFFDVNEILALVGRIRLQDDYVLHIAHASYLGPQEGDEDRILASTQPDIAFDTQEARQEFGAALTQRLRDNLAIIRRPLETKAIIIDLDDTLWRGIAAEEDKECNDFAEGWPLGLAEALITYKARGGMLAICSKNHHSVIAERFPFIWKDRLSLKDFASIQINFDRKSDNISKILGELNILPENALFIDDNPREIAEVRATFPSMRYLNEEHYDWRRRLLLDPSNQVDVISTEARLRTQSVQARTSANSIQDKMSREEWLSSLDMKQEIVIVSHAEHPRFPRAFELINKTNQFNTNGKRWERAELEDLLSHGGHLICSVVRDRLVDHGLVSVTIVRGNEILQSVLSCRSFGVGVEYASAHVACSMILREHSTVRASITETPKNLSSRAYFSELGFTSLGNGLFETKHAPAIPDYIDLHADAFPPLEKKSAGFFERVAKLAKR